MFSGGDYHEVRRWLWNFLTSHAKREHARAEVVLDDAGAREGTSYGARIRLGDRETPVIEFEYADVARHRGELAWCRALDER
ncbi:MAG: hypothetical protein HYR86_05565, partial [Candidatus Rokubacteria bacterium]|nr:hypothetical protein [Candidatus Rokubacteria bacterium]